MYCSTNAILSGCLNRTITFKGVLFGRMLCFPKCTHASFSSLLAPKRNCEFEFGHLYLFIYLFIFVYVCACVSECVCVCVCVRARVEGKESVQSFIYLFLN